MLIEKKFFRPAIRRLTRKHKLALYVAETATLTGTYWDGGSVSNYSWFDPRTEQYVSIPCPTAPPRFGGGKPPVVRIHPGQILLQEGTFCGKGATPSLTIHGDSVLDVLQLDCPLVRPPIQVLHDWLQEQEAFNWARVVRELGHLQVEVEA